MIRYLKQHQIDRNKWDSCIQSSVQKSVYGCSWYLDVICSDWDALVEDDYESVMPVTKNSKYLMNYIYPPFFAQQLGIFHSAAADDQVCARFLNAIPKVYSFIEINLNTFNHNIPESFATKSNRNYILNLHPDHSVILSGYSENLTRNLKKAVKNELQINRNGSVLDVITLFRSNRGRFVENLKDSNYHDFARLCNAVEKNAALKVYTVSSSTGEMVAGAVFFEFMGTGIFIFSGLSSTGKNLSAMPHLIDTYLKDVAGKIKILDFEGSNDQELARFYKSFGSTECVYLQIKKNQLPPPWKWFKN
ncbi:MAG: hypothetical protein IPK08_01015 [Bacteroidetes bacterium]|nr:hypothetical protein [Bacteroidota bacterium]